MELCIETSLYKSSLALSKDGQILAFSQSEGTKDLTGRVQRLMSEHQVAFSDLKAVSVSAGPGSYTGLRVGVSLAKGLAFALEIPLLAVDTLKLMAKDIDSELPKCPMIDAKRMEVYTALYDSSLDLLVEPRAWLWGQSSFVGDLKVVYFGDGAAKFKDLLKAPKWNFVEGGLPLAKNMPGLGQEVDSACFEPFYLKEYQTQVSKNPLESIKKIFLAN